MSRFRKVIKKKELESALEMHPLKKLDKDVKEDYIKGLIFMAIEDGKVHENEKSYIVSLIMNVGLEKTFFEESVLSENNYEEELLLFIDRLKEFDDEIKIIFLIEVVILSFRDDKFDKREQNMFDDYLEIFGMQDKKDDILNIALPFSGKVENLSKDNYKKSLKVLNNPALFAGLQGSVFNYADNVVMNSRQGHGFGGEKLNHMYDVFSGKDAKIVGGNNVKNGADRIVNGNEIQTKYCNSGSKCVNECFDKQTGNMKYFSDNGKPMQIEVPSDKYNDAVKSMEDKIRKGKVPGVTNPKEAKNIIKKGEFTYQQAVNVAKFGTIESLTYDAVNGIKIAGTSMGISSVISFSIALWNGEDFEKALKNSIYSGFNVGGIAWASSILTAQLGRTGLEQALRGSTDYLVKSMGSKAYHFLANGLRSSGKIYGAAAINNVSKILRGNIVTGIATTVVMSVPDFYRMFNGKISGAQVFKNVTKTSAGVAGGIGGWMGGAAAGAAVGSAVPIVGTAVGGFVGGLLGSFAGGSTGSKVAETILDEFIEDDANEMMKIVEKVFSELAFDYLLNENEAKDAINKFQEKDIPELLRNMYSSDNRTKYIKVKLLDIIEPIVKNRKKVFLPKNQEIIKKMGEVLEELSDLETQREIPLKKRVQNIFNNYKNIILEIPSDFKILFPIVTFTVSIANADGEIGEEEISDIKDIVKGLENSSVIEPKYNGFLEETISLFKHILQNPPSFDESLEIMESLDFLESSDYMEIRKMLLSIIELDGIIDKREEKCIKKFDNKVKELNLFIIHNSLQNRMVSINKI